MIKKDKTLLIVMTVGLSLMLILRDIYGLDINKFLYLAFVVGCMVLANYRTLVNMVCFILPLVCGLPGTYIMPCAVVLLIFKRGRLGLAPIFFVICLSLLEIVASFWYPESGIPNMVQYISFLAVMILLIHNTAEIDYEEGVRLYLYGVVLLCAVIMIATIQDAPKNWLDIFARGAFRFGELQKEQESAIALTLNANSLAYYSITGVGCGIFMAERRKGWARAFYIILAVIAATAGFFTLSRSWLLVMALCLLLYFFSKLRTPRQFISMVGVLAVLVIAIVILLQQNPRLMDGFLTRFTDEDMETGNGRTEIFTRWVEIYLNDIRFFFLGTGVTQYKIVGGYGSFHNGTQQILVCTGFVGFVIYMFALIGPVLQARKMVKGNFAAWLPLLGVVGFVQTIQFLNPMMLMLPYVIGIYALRAGGQKNEIISDNRGHGRGRPLGLETR